MTAVNPGMAIEKTTVASASRRRSTGKIGHGSTKNTENLAQSDIIPMEAQEEPGDRKKHTVSTTGGMLSELVSEC